MNVDDEIASVERFAACTDAELTAMSRNLEGLGLEELRALDEEQDRRYRAKRPPVTARAAVRIDPHESAEDVRKRLVAAIEEARPDLRRPSSTLTSTADVTVVQNEPVTICLADVKPEQIHWLWQGRIPWAKLSVLDGDPGLGKSTVTIDIAARGSRGDPMPDDQALGERFATVLLSAEDGLADTIVPRLIAHGADLQLVHALSTVKAQDGERMPAVPADIDTLERAVADLKARCAVSRVLVILDPLSAYLGAATDAHKDSDIRRALAPLAQMAERTGAAVLLVRHLNKGGGASAIYRGGGSIAIAGAARSVLLVAKDVDNEEERVVAPVKSNIAKPASALRYRVVDDHGVGRIEWIGVAQVTADQLVAPRDPKAAGKLEEAMEWLRQLLAAGPVLVSEVRRMAKEERGYSWATVQRAREKVGAKHDRVGFGPGHASRWHIPSHTTMDEMSGGN